MMAIIKSLLQTDMYKLTMLQAFYYGFPKGTNAKYVFKNRSKIPLAEYSDKVRSEINYLSNLTFSDEEIQYLESTGYFRSEFLDFLFDFRLKSKFIEVSTTGDDLNIVTEGSLIQTMLYEIYVLSIVHEVYSKLTHPEPNYGEGEKRLEQKIKKIKEYSQTNDFKFADFGTRRAFNSNWHEYVLQTLKTELDDNVFIGTSNLYFAKNLELTPIGTFAHEYVQSFQGIGLPIDSQKKALAMWLDIYNGDLGIALTDTLGLNKFLKDFDWRFATLYSGVRHDSGDPFEFTERIIGHYEKLGIDPNTKSIVFSDGLDVDLAIRLAEFCKGSIKCSFGIGTNLSNDLGYDFLQIVMKLVGCGVDRLNPVAKISDSEGKGMCEDQNYLNYLKTII